MTEEEIELEMPNDYHPAFHSEPKAADHGRVNGRVVVLDYGLPGDMVDGYRRQYGRYKGRAQRLDLPPDATPPG